MQRVSNLSANERGMTLVEIIVVIVLISIIGGIVIQGVIGKGDTAKAKLNMVKMEKLKSSIETYRLEYNGYPAKLEDLVTRSAEIEKSGKLFTPLASDSDLVDVWNFPYIYKTENNNRTFTLSSLGSDGIEGGDGAKQDVTVRP